MASMNELVGLCVSLLIIVVIAYLGPGLGEEISTAMPVNESGDFANATTGADIWTSGFNLVGIVVLVIFIAVAVRALKGIQGGNGD